MTLEERIKKYMDEEGMSRAEAFRAIAKNTGSILKESDGNKESSETAAKFKAYKDKEESKKADKKFEEEDAKEFPPEPSLEANLNATDKPAVKPTLADNIKGEEKPDTVAKVATTWDSLKKKLAADEVAVEDLKTKEAGKLQTEEQRRKRSSKLGVLLKSLLNSAALLYAAKKGVVSDIKLETPDDAKQIRDIERDMDYERTLLRDRISETRRTNSEVSRIEEGGLRRKEAQDDRTDARNKSIKLAEAKAAARDAKDIKKAAARDAKDIKKAAADEDKILDKIIDKFEGDDEAMRSALEAHGVDTEIAKDISGDTRSYFWDTPAGGQKLYELKQKHIRNILGGTNAKKSTDNTVTGNDASKGPRKQTSNKGNTQYKLGEKIISEEEYLRLKGKIRNVK